VFETFEKRIGLIDFVILPNYFKNGGKTYRNTFKIRGNELSTVKKK